MRETSVSLQERLTLAHRVLTRGEDEIVRQQYAFGGGV
jgi:hypothetical protein